jgi:hypothetical protein
VPVGACASEDANVELAGQTTPHSTLSSLAGKAGDFFAIVTPQLGAKTDALRALGYASEADSWVLPETVFNLDWKER